MPPWGSYAAAGFPLPGASYASAPLDAYLYGPVVQESALPFEGTEGGAGRTAASMRGTFEESDYPYLVEIATQHVMQHGYDFTEEFRLGLEVVLDGLERLL